MPVKPFQVKTVSIIEDSIAFVFTDKRHAMNALKKNPKASYMEGQDEEIILLYNNADIDFSKAIKRV